MDYNVEDCPVCMITFDDTLRRPRTLPCGHTFCTVCIDAVKEQDEVPCPTCRVSHTVPETGQFPVSYITEAFIRRLKGTALTSQTSKSGKITALPVTQTAQEGPAGLGRMAQSLLQEQEAKVLSAITTCQEVQAQLDQYCTMLAGWGECQQQLEDKLQVLVDQSKSARMLVHQEEIQVVANREEVHQRELKLHALLQTLRTVATQQEAYEVIDDAYCRSEEESQRAEECLGMFPNVDTITTITKVREASQAALKAAATIQGPQDTVGSPAGAAKYLGLPATLASSIVDRLEDLMVPSLKVEDLCNQTQTARNLLQAGLVFAIHQVEGKSQHARISFQENRQYLQSLQDQPLPPRAVTMQLGEVVPLSPPCRVFLDLQWPGHGPRRLVVYLSRDTAWGRQFLLLCTGQRGACYANTKLHGVFRVGMEGEYVVGGDYQQGDGTGGAALLPHLDNRDCWESGRAGAVMGWWGRDSARGAQFSLVTRKRSGGKYGCVFGNVVEGLEVLEEAAKHRPITEVTVVQCGVLLWED